MERKRGKIGKRGIARKGAGILGLGFFFSSPFPSLKPTRLLREHVSSCGGSSNETGSIWRWGPPREPRRRHVGRDDRRVSRGMWVLDAQFVGTAVSSSAGADALAVRRGMRRAALDVLTWKNRLIKIY